MGPPKFSTWLICSNKGGGGDGRSSFSELRPGLGYSTPTVKKVLVLVGFRVGGFFCVCMSLLSLCVLLWLYGLSSFQAGGAKLERFLPKNQHTQRKLLNFENWINGKLSKSAKI